MNPILNNLLVELLVEELPPKALRALGEVFGREVRQGLVDKLLVLPEARWNWFASPRRLAVHISGVEERQRPRIVVEKLMPVSVAFNSEGNPTPALLKKMSARSFRTDDLAAFDRRMDGKTETLFYQWTDDGFLLEQVLGDVLDDALAKLPIPKVMSYQLADGWTTVNFVRPAHGLVALYGATVVPIQALGLRAGRNTQGHRFEAAKTTIELVNADSYATQLEQEGAVIASFTARRAEIVKQIHAAANKEGLRAIEDDALLDEVTALVERPNVLTCQFESAFLEIPAECLILTMKANQKYFPLLDAAGKLTNKFLVVSNIQPADPSHVIEGNERVVRPRLADAKFFFDQDRKRPLSSHLENLKKVIYHNKLGTTFDKVSRIQNLAVHLLAQLPADTATNQALVEEAAQLCKCDLQTAMVGEFPELQGIMGRYYALADGKSSEVAESIREHYLPRGAGDELPQTTTGMALALADKLDTIAGVFAIDQKPTGAKDPFGLRRAAIGVLRILIERKLSIDLLKVITLAVAQQPFKAAKDTTAEIYEYIMERLRGYYLEGSQLNFTTEMFDAVLANRPVSPWDFDQRLRALQSFLKLSDAQSLAAANKRITNILKKAEGKVSTDVLTDKFVEAAEKTLFSELQCAEADTAPLFAARNYKDALTRLAALRPAVDQFFDGVMVMAEDSAIRNNRLALLARLRNVFLQVADLSRLPG